MSVTLAEGFDLLTREVRRCFHHLAGLAEALHSETGVTAPMRAVMEHVAVSGPDPVPVIARAKGVSRQHIQQQADALVAAGLCAYRPNPAHKRSSLLALTADGESLFSDIRKKERAVLDAAGGALDAQELAAAAATLARLRVTLPRVEDVQ